MSASLFPRLALLASLLPAFTFSQDISRMDEVVQSYVPDRFMGTVLIARGDELLLDKAYGSANVEWDIPNTTETKFRIGSMTKQFTAAAVLMLEEQGKVKTTDLLSTHMPDTPEAWKDITVHHLLSHQAGLSDFAARPDFGQLMLLPTTTEKTIALFRDMQLDFRPGTAFRYSNSNYIVLGRLIESLSGGTYEDFLQQNIFTPLGMTSSGYDSNTALINKRAAGYAPAPGGLRNAYYLDTSLAHAGGALYSTTGDLLQWCQALFNGELLSQESVAKMTTPNIDGYGYGLNIIKTDKGTQIWHNGSINGFSSMMVYYPDDELLLVGLSNVRGPDVESIVAHLDSIAHGQPVILHSERKEISLSADSLSQYVGTYELRADRAITITLENGQLMAQPMGQDKLPLFPESETTFFLKVVEASFEFQTDSMGAVTGVILTQDRRARTFARVAPQNVR